MSDFLGGSGEQQAFSQPQPIGRMPPAFPTITTAGGTTITTGGDVTQSRARVRRPGDDFFIDQFTLANPFVNVAFAPQIAALRDESLGITRELLGMTPAEMARLAQAFQFDVGANLPTAISGQFDVPSQIGDVFSMPRAISGAGVDLPSTLPEEIGFISTENLDQNPFFRARATPFIQAMDDARREASRRGISGPLAELGINPIRGALSEQRAQAELETRAHNLGVFQNQLAAEQARFSSALAEEQARFASEQGVFGSELAAEQARFQSGLGVFEAQMAAEQARFASERERFSTALQQELGRLGAEGARFEAEQSLRNLQRQLAQDISGESQRVLSQELAAIGMSNQEIELILGSMLPTTELGQVSTGEQTQGILSGVNVGIKV